VSCLSSRPLSRSRSAYQVDADRVDHLSRSNDRNYPFYSSYFYYSVDQKGSECCLGRHNRYHALVVPTKSTSTESTTLPVRTTGTLLSTLPTFKIVSTEKGVSVVLVDTIVITLSQCLPSRQ
jgi:hypothetical protein